MRHKPYRSNAEKQLRQKRIDAKKQKWHKAMAEIRAKKLADPNKIEEDRIKTIRHWNHIKERALNTLEIAERKLAELRVPIHESKGAE